MSRNRRGGRFPSVKVASFKESPRAEPMLLREGNWVEAQEINRGGNSCVKLGGINHAQRRRYDHTQEGLFLHSWNRTVMKKGKVDGKNEMRPLK